MLKSLKTTVLRLAKSSGAMGAAANSGWRKKRLLILAYHGVAIEDENQWNPSLYVTSAFLRERMRLLETGGANVLPLSEGLECLRAGTLPEKAVAITFDDGNYDFRVNAWPVLQEFGFPVTLYASTYYSENNLPVFDVACSYLLWKASGKTLDLATLTGENDTISLDGTELRSQALQRITKHVKDRLLSAGEKNDLLKRLSASIGFDFEGFCEKRLLHLLKPDEIQDLVKAGVDVQLHTHRHRTPSDELLFKKEIEDNRAALLKSADGSYTHFCYPSGVHKTEFYDWLRECGVESATTCDVALASSNDDPMILPRLVDTNYITAIEFEGWLSGISSFLPKRS